MLVTQSIRGSIKEILGFDFGSLPLYGVFALSLSILERGEPRGRNSARGVRHVPFSTAYQ